MPDTLSRDRQLRDRLVSREILAFAELYDEYSPIVYGVARRVTGDPQHAADVCQNVFLQVWEHPERFDPSRGSFRPWLATFAHHRSVDRLRHEQASRRRDDRAARSVSPSDPGVEATVDALLDAEHVRRAVDGLPDVERAAIDLAYFGGRSYRQVARELDLPEGTVKSRILRGLHHLEGALGPQAAN